MVSCKYKIHKGSGEEGVLNMKKKRCVEMRQNGGLTQVGIRIKF